MIEVQANKVRQSPIPDSAISSGQAASSHDFVKPLVHNHAPGPLILKKDEARN